MTIWLTERCPVLDIVTEEIAGADGLELREALQQPLALGSLAHARRTNQNYSRRSLELHCLFDAEIETGTMDVILCKVQRLRIARYQTQWLRKRCRRRPTRILSKPGE